MTFAVLLTLVLLHATVALVVHLERMGGGKLLMEIFRALELRTPVATSRLGFALGGMVLAVARVVEWQDSSMRHQLDGESLGIPLTCRRNTELCPAELKLATFITLLASVTRTVNLPLFLLIWGQLDLLKVLPLSPLLFTSLVVAFQRTSYFAFGGSNSLAT